MLRKVVVGLEYLSRMNLPEFFEALNLSYTF
jgi:hypothetical protein